MEFLKVLSELVEGTRALGGGQDPARLIEELRTRVQALTGAERAGVTLGEARLMKDAGPMGSRLVVPLAGPGGVIGAVWAESPRPGAFDEVHEKAVAILAAQAAVALETVRLREDTERQAPADALTGLFDRPQFVAQCEDHLRRARRYQETLAVVFLDVDNLKDLNERHGQQAGERALQVVGAALREWVRQTDEVARLGRDEFAALLLSSDRTTARQVIDRIRATVAELRLAGGGDTAVTLSAGIALFPSDGGDMEWLFSRADKALAEAKRRGGNQVMLAEDLSRASGPDLAARRAP